MRHDIVYDKNGIDGLYAFFLWDSKGIMTTTKHPNILFSLLRTKASANFHAKMYAQGRADGTFPFIEFRAFCIKYNAPEWFKSAVENQKFKYYDQNEPILKTVAQHKIQYPYIS